MTHPTDDDLERVAKDCTTAAQVMRETGTFETGQSILDEAAAMLRACKGWGWQPMENAPIFGKVLRYDPRRREGEQVFECPADGGFWRHEKMPGMWMHMPEPPGSAALDPAPDHGTWNAAIEAVGRLRGRDVQKRDADDVGEAYDLAIDEAQDAIRALAKKGQAND